MAAVRRDPIPSARFLHVYKQRKHEQRVSIEFKVSVAENGVSGWWGGWVGGWVGGMYVCVCGGGGYVWGWMGGGMCVCVGGWGGGRE